MSDGGLAEDQELVRRPATFADAVAQSERMEREHAREATRQRRLAWTRRQLPLWEREHAIADANRFIGPLRPDTRPSVPRFPPSELRATHVTLARPPSPLTVDEAAAALETSIPETTWEEARAAHEALDRPPSPPTADEAAAALDTSIPDIIWREDDGVIRIPGAHVWSPTADEAAAAPVDDRPTDALAGGHAALGASTLDVHTADAPEAAAGAPLTTPTATARPRGGPRPGQSTPNATATGLHTPRTVPSARRAARLRGELQPSRPRPPATATAGPPTGLSALFGDLAVTDEAPTTDAGTAGPWPPSAPAPHPDDAATGTEPSSPPRQSTVAPPPTTRRRPSLALPESLETSTVAVDSMSSLPSLHTGSLVELAAAHELAPHQAATPTLDRDAMNLLQGDAAPPFVEGTLDDLRGGSDTDDLGALLRRAVVSSPAAPRMGSTRTTGDPAAGSHDASNPCIHQAAHTAAHEGSGARARDAAPCSDATDTGDAPPRAPTARAAAAAAAASGPAGSGRPPPRGHPPAARSL